MRCVVPSGIVTQRERAVALLIQSNSGQPNWPIVWTTKTWRKKILLHEQKIFADIEPEILHTRNKIGRAMLFISA